MGDDHPSLDTMARWLAGELEHEAVLRELAPHLSDNCSVCRRNQEEIERLKEECGHWSETVAVFETREAPELARRLEGLSHEERMRLVEEDEDLQTWGLSQHLLKEARKALFEDPLSAIETARLAVRITEHLGDSYHPDWVLELRAKAHAHLGNALRVVGELKAADHEFLMADECLGDGGAGSVRVQAEILSLKGSLRLDQRRLLETIELVNRALHLYQSIQDRNGVVRALLQKAKALNESSESKEALGVLREAVAQIHPEEEPKLFAQVRFNQLAWLTMAGQYQEAAQILPEVQGLFSGSARSTETIRILWCEALIAQGLGRTDEAIAAYREVRERFLELGKAYDAALVSLDLATLHAERGETEALKRIAAEVLPVFQSRDIHREALAALLLFYQACAEERATAEMIRQATDLLRQGRKGNGD